MVTEFRKIEKELKKRARKKDIEAMLELGELSGSVGTKWGLRYYIKAACQGSACACREISMFYYTKGNDILKDNSYTKRVNGEIYKCFKIARKWAVKLYKSGVEEYLDMIKDIDKTLNKIRSKCE